MLILGLTALKFGLPLLREFLAQQQAHMAQQTVLMQQTNVLVEKLSAQQATFDKRLARIEKLVKPRRAPVSAASVTAPQTSVEANRA
jgi:hypothetical protein